MKKRKRKRPKNQGPTRFERITNFFRTSYFFYGTLFALAAYPFLSSLYENPNKNGTYKKQAIITPGQGWLIGFAYLSAAIWFFTKSIRKKRSKTEVNNEKGA
jgi:hypothetical protein